MFQSFYLLKLNFLLQKVDIPEVIQRRFPSYKLYVYGEGHYAEQLARKQYNGVPVLFIPGNGGSYKQGMII